jgi:hypothetical protein
MFRTNLTTCVHRTPRISDPRQFRKAPEDGQDRPKHVLIIYNYNFTYLKGGGCVDWFSLFHTYLNITHQDATSNTRNILCPASLFSVSRTVWDS